MDTEPVGYDIALPKEVSKEHEEEIMEHVGRDVVPGLIRDAKAAGRWIDWSTLRIEVVTVSGGRFLRAGASGTGRREPQDDPDLFRV